jgi:HSP20 family protein
VDGGNNTRRECHRDGGKEMTGDDRGDDRKMTLPVRRIPGQLPAWAPMRQFEDLYQELGRLMQSAFAEPEPAAWIPAADVSETDDAYHIEIDLPGVKHDDVSVEVIGGELIVQGEHKEREKVGQPRRRTRRFGTFEYRATLPGELDPEKVEANLSDGVLTVRVPKSERSRRRKVEIKQG